MLSEARRHNLQRTLNPRTVCYIGGSFLEHTINANRRMGFNGEVWVVNPKLDNLAGIPCFKSVDDLPGAPDATFLAVNREMTNTIVTELNGMNAGGVICYAAGYREVGGVGVELEAELVANAGDLALVGPNCYGINNYLHGVPLLAIPSLGERVERGSAFIAQSGNLCVNVCNNQRSAPLAYVISCGNQSVLDISDYLDVLVDDPAITCFTLFIETIPNIARFSRIAARALEAGKPIIAHKAGVSAMGKKLALSHTASLAGDDAMYQALFDRLGIIRVEAPSDMLETAKFITHTGVPEGRRIVVYTCSGGDSETVADLAEPFGIELPQPDQDQYDTLRKVMPDFANITNPFDYNTNFWGDYDTLSTIFPVLVDDNVDAGLLVMDVNPEDTGEVDGSDAVLRALCHTQAKAGIPMAWTTSMPENSTPRPRAIAHNAGVAALQGIREGVHALAKSCLFGERRRELMAQGGTDHLAVPPASKLTGEPVAMNEADSKQALAAYGLPIPDGRVASVAEAGKVAAGLGFPVALKLLSDSILHKTDVGGVALALEDAAAVQRAADDMAARLGITEVLIEPMAAKPVAELLVGVTHNDSFGPVLVIGAGGVLVELFRDAVSLLLPVGEDDVRHALSRLKIAKLLDGFRGGPKADMDALVGAIIAIGAYAHDHRGRLAELDVNPLLVMADGDGVLAVDALIRQTPDKEA
ncbi:MAG: acetate--CoA ligase family protein [Pseudomonadota bacterium]